MRRRSVAAAFALVMGSSLATVRADIAGFGGFAPVNLSAPSGSSSVGYGNGSTFTLTDGHTLEASSGFFATPQNVSSFTASFTYTCVGGDGGQYSNADGGSFVVQTDSRGFKALGSNGNSLGVAGVGLLNPSAEFEFNLYGTGPGFIYATNGTPPPNFASPTATLDNGHTYNVTLSFVNNSASVTLVDTATNQVYTANTPNQTPLTSLLGGSNAFVGFTGSTGGVSSTQQISNFRFVSTPTFSPISATGWNQDMVVENTAPQSGAIADITATMDNGTLKTGTTYIEKGTDPAAPNDGLPASGSTFFSQHDAQHIFQMQSYTGNNALLIDEAAPTGSLVFAKPAAYTALSLLVASGHGPNAFDLTIHYANGSSQTIPAVAAPDWFFNFSVAWASDDRVTPSTGASTYDQETSGPNLYQEDVLLPDTTDPIASISVSFDSGTSLNNGQLAIFAVSGDATTLVPEPTMIGLLAMAALGMLGRPRWLGIGA